MGSDIVNPIISGETEPFVAGVGTIKHEGETGYGKKREKIIRNITQTIGAACTCSGRTNHAKNVEMATRILEGLERKGFI